MNRRGFIRAALASVFAAPLLGIAKAAGIDLAKGKDQTAYVLLGPHGMIGQFPEPITKLIPWSDDVLLIGCEHSLWRFENGKLTQITESNPCE